MAGCLRGKCSVIVVPLGAEHTFCGEQVRISTLPTTGYGGTMEVNQEVMTGSRLEKVDAEVHVHLTVAREEINLHTCDPYFLAPGEFLLTVLGTVQTELRRRSAINPSHRRVIPDHGLNALINGIFHSILDGLAIFHHIPLSINQHVREFELDCHINIFADDVVIIATMIVGPINPGYHTWLDPVGISQLARFGNIGNQGRGNDFRQVADHQRAPRTMPLTRDLYSVLGRSYAIELTIVVEA